MTIHHWMDGAVGERVLYAWVELSQGRHRGTEEGIWLIKVKDNTLCGQSKNDQAY